MSEAWSGVDDTLRAGGTSAPLSEFMEGALTCGKVLIELRAFVQRYEDRDAHGQYEAGIVDAVGTVRHILDRHGVL